MKHKNYHEIIAENNYKLGLQLGNLFGDRLKRSIDKQAKNRSLWKKKVTQARKSLSISKKFFPHIIEELEGYAEGAKVKFQDLWTLSLEDEVSKDKCTTIVTNGGNLISHNEDWEPETEDTICILKKTVKDTTIIEIFYYNTLGGNSISINSHGFVQGISTLTHTDKQIGIPRNVVARWLSETRNPESDFKLLKKVKRAFGYNHLLVSKEGKIFNIECSAKTQFLMRPEPPFIHTNHYLSKLKKFEADDNSCGSKERFSFASKNVRDSMTDEELKELISDNSNGDILSVFNERTIGWMIIDKVRKKIFVWLLREPEMGWVSYPLDFLNS
jgi:isopenicillin-N N-acyltransferase-like protein